MILISAHRDKVMDHFRFDYENGKYIGLLDNQIGEIVVNSLLVSDPTFCLLEKNKRIKIFFGDSEEWGTITPMPVLKKEDIALVVDVCSGNRYKGYDIAIENVTGISKKEAVDLKESLEWEGFKVLLRMYDGSPEDEDEAFYWHAQGNKAISFIIPIENGGKDTGWHKPDCSISIEKVALAKQILKRTVNYLL